jgi:transposase
MGDAMGDGTLATSAAARTILALDLEKFKSVACVLEAERGSGGHRFETIATSPSAVAELLAEVRPDRLVIEACSIAGWVCDLARPLGIAVVVANANSEAWQWKRVKRKTDRDDALKLAKLSLMNQLPQVHVPEPAVRQWKGLIKYRHALVDRRTGIKNTIRSLLDSQGLGWPARSKGWTAAALAELKQLSRPLGECPPLELWRGQLAVELTLLEQMMKAIAGVDAQLDRLQRTDERVARLKTVPQVGPRLAELVVSTIDDAKRFKSAKQISAYAGLVPRQYQSGTMDRKGRITGQGPGLLRRVLVQVAWGMQRREGRGREVFERLCHGQRTRRKQAAVAVARKILVWCWAMLRDGTDWRENQEATPPRLSAAT